MTDLPDPAERLEELRYQLTEQTRICELLALIGPVCSDPAALNRALRQLASCHIAFGSALRRMVDDKEKREGATCAIN